MSKNEFIRHTNINKLDTEGAYGRGVVTTMAEETR